MDWELHGMAPHLAARLADMGIGDDAAIAAWVGANPNGSERIGRVMMAELRAFLTAPRDDHTLEQAGIT